jgi:hypothetical protein
LVHGSTAWEEKEMDNFSIKVRGNVPCAVVVAGIDGDDKNAKKISEKIGLVVDKLKNGILLLLRFGFPHQNELVTFKHTTIIVTGKLCYVLSPTGKYDALHCNSKDI